MKKTLREIINKIDNTLAILIKENQKKRKQSLLEMKTGS